MIKFSLVVLLALFSASNGELLHCDESWTYIEGYGLVHFHIEVDSAYFIHGYRASRL